jgi:L-methionine (R)-S-oxide reductase
VTAAADTYRGALEAVDRVVNRESEVDEVLRRVVGVLHDRVAHYSWVGIYLVEGADLVLGPWKGPLATDHVRIPVGQGVCGAAAASGRTEIVADVNADERYLACFPSTRSEIVVPIAYEGRVVGEIDIDSDEPAAFGEADRAFLERVALLISPHCLVGWDQPRWAERVVGDAPADGFP